MPKSSARRAAISLACSLAVSLALSGESSGGCPTPTELASPPASVEGPSTAADVTSANTSGTDAQDPTAEKPESKLWYAHGTWWAVLWNSDSLSQGGQEFEIHRYNDAAVDKGWNPTGVSVSASNDRTWLRRYDVLYDESADDVYVASHEFADAPSCSGTCDVRVYRFSWTGTHPTYWALDTAVGFPKLLKTTTGATLTNQVETLVIDKAANGVIWATWTKANRVHVAYTNGACSGSSVSSNCDWIEVTGRCSGNSSLHCITAADCTPSGQTCSFPSFFTNIATDDISSIIAFRRTDLTGAFNVSEAIGIMWSDHVTEKMYFSVHDQAADPWVWSSAEMAYEYPGLGGKGEDDHINLKRSDACTVGDTAGIVNKPCRRDADCSPDSVCKAHRILAATKTSRSDIVPQPTTDPQVLLLTRSVTGTWAAHEFGQVQHHHTRPIVEVDDVNQCIHMFATRDEADIVMKVSPLEESSIAFTPSGEGVRIMDTAERFNNATSTKQTLNGFNPRLLVMASEDSTRTLDGAGGYRYFRECLCDDANVCTTDSCNHTYETCSNVCDVSTCPCGGVCNNCQCGAP